MKFGACYYPEHWPEERWARDVELMWEAGVNTLRIGEFAWTTIEKREGEFDFAWLDRFIALLKPAGIRVVLGTPTASPPKWIMERHPDLYKRDMYGHVRGFGTRMHYCFNNDAYPRYVRRIVGAMVRHYKDDPSVIGWQIDNEFGCVDTTWCYCDTCKSKFQQWLADKYGTIDALNAAWGTVVWNNTYNSFGEIETPKLTVYQLHNPGLQLDWRRFSSEAVVKFQNIQVELIRSAAPHQPITHNMMGPFNEINYYDLARSLDVAGLDVYPNFPEHGEPINPYTPALHHDITRGLKDGAGYWILEHMSGTPGAHILKATPKPGELRRWSYQSIGHGADMLLYFRWRTATIGAEQYWHGILQHSGEPGRNYEEARRIGTEFARLASALEGTVVKSDVAIVRDYENDWVFAIQPHNPGYSYLRRLKHYHRYFIEKHNGVDVVGPHADFGAYKVLLFPHLALLDEALADKVRRYVEGGGVAVLDFRCGIKLPDNRMRMEVAPGPFRELLGIAIDDYGIIAEGETQRVAFAGDGGDAAAACEARVWYDVVEPRGAETVATFASDYFAGAPAVTRNRYGKGTAYYVSTELDAAGLARLMDLVLADGGAAPDWTVDDPDVEVTVRRKAGTRVYFVLNHSGEARTVRPPAGAYDLLADRALSGEVALAPNDVLVFRLQSDR